MEPLSKIQLYTLFRLDLNDDRAHLPCLWLSPIPTPAAAQKRHLMTEHILLPPQLHKCQKSALLKSTWKHTGVLLKSQLRAESTYILLSQRAMEPNCTACNWAAGLEGTRRDHGAQAMSSHWSSTGPFPEVHRHVPAEHWAAALTARIMGCTGGHRIWAALLLRAPKVTANIRTVSEPCIPYV